MFIYKKRLSFIDNLRAITMLCVLLLHCLLSFSKDEVYPWPIHDIKESEFYAQIVASIHLFSMPLFFFAGGLVASMLFYKTGMKKFVTNRFMRIVIPFVFLMCVRVYKHTADIATSYLQQCAPKFGSSCFSFYRITQAIRQEFSWEKFTAIYNSTSLYWFLYYLLIFYVLAIFFLTISRYTSQNIKNYLPKKNILLSNLHAMLFLFAILGIFIFDGQAIYYFPTPLSFKPALWALYFYGGFFILGWISWQHREFWQKVYQNTFIYFIVAIILLPLYLTISKYQIENQLNLNHILIFFIPCLIILAGTACFLSVISICVRYLQHKNKILRYLADASYWIYLTQFPFVIILQTYFAQKLWPGLLKIVIIYITVLSICIITYQLLVRHTFLGRIIGSYKKD